MRLENRVALITGAAHGVKGELMGFGGAAAWLFAEEGAKVVLTDIDVDAGERATAQMRDEGHDVMFIELDVTVESEWKRAIQATLDAYGTLNVLVNNAGTAGSGKVEDTTESSWDRQMDIHAKGVFLGTKYAIPPMRDAGGGSIVNISSILRHDRKPGVDGLPRGEGGQPDIHQVGRGPACPGRHQGELGASRILPYAAERDLGIRRGAPKAVPEADTDEPPRKRNGSRVRHPVPRIRRVVLHDRLRAGHRRWRDYAVATGSAKCLVNSGDLAVLSK